MEDPHAALREQQQRLAQLASRLKAALGTDQEQELLARVAAALDTVNRSRTALPRQLQLAANTVYAPRTRIIGLVMLGAALAGAACCLLGWLNPWLLILLAVHLAVGVALATAPAPDPDAPPVAGTRAQDRLWAAGVAVVGLVPTGLTVLSPWWLAAAIPLTAVGALATAIAMGKIDQSAAANPGGDRG